MIKLVFMVRRREGITREEFQRYWREEHADLVKRQTERKAAQKAFANSKVVKADGEWSGESFVQQSDALSKA